MSTAIALTSAAKATPPAAPGGAAGGAVPVQTAGRPKPTKAELVLYDAAPAGSGGAATGTQTGKVSFQFNPKEVTIQKSAKWERKTTKGAKKAGPPEFSGAEPCKLTVEMFFDATLKDSTPVVDQVEALLGCLVPTDKSIENKKPSPPLVVLHWGSISSFPAFVTSVSAKYTLFSSDGIPIRAVCSVSMEEMPDDTARQNPTSGSENVRRVHRTTAGDTLASVAFATYGDPTAWRALAAFNRIDDPLRVRSGTTLLLPAPEELGA